MTATPKQPAAKSISKGPRDAIALLKEDHAKVRKMFVQFAASKDDSERHELARQICRELRVHTAIEEEIFYPAVRRTIDADDILDEAIVEHASAKDLIAQIEAGAYADDMWDAKVKVLHEYIDHHIKEEHTDLFPIAKKSSLDMRQLGAELAQRKQQLLADESEAEVISVTLYQTPDPAARVRETDPFEI